MPLGLNVIGHLGDVDVGHGLHDGLLEVADAAKLLLRHRSVHLRPAPARYDRLGIVLPLCSCLIRVNSLRFRGSGKGVNGQDTSGSSSAESVSYSDPYSDPDTSSAVMSDSRRRPPPPGPWLPASEDCTAAIAMMAVRERGGNGVRRQAE